MGSAANRDKVEGILAGTNDLEMDWKGLSVDLIGQIETTSYLFYQIISSFPNSIMFISATGKVEAASSLMFEKYLEASFDEVIGKPLEHLNFAAFVDPCTTVFITNLLQNSLISGTDYENVLMEATDKHKRTIYLEISVKAIKSTNDEFLGLLLYVTEQIVKLDIASSQNEMDFFLKKMGSLSAGVVHEVRNPIQSISGMVQLMQLKYKCDEKLMDYCDIMSTEVKQVNILLTEFLGCANMGQAKMQSANINRICSEISRVACGKLYVNDVGFEECYGENIPDMILDCGKIRQAMVNLLSNAADAILEVDEEERRKTEPEYKGNVTVSTYYDYGLNECHVVIEDNGIGMSPYVLSSIMQPFFTTKRFGTGMGICIIDQVVRDHGGRVDISSVEGVGTKFDIVLPELAGLAQCIEPEVPVGEAPKQKKEKATKATKADKATKAKLENEKNKEVL